MTQSKSSKNLETFLKGSREAYLRNKDAMKSETLPDDPIISIVSMSSETRTYYAWRLLCRYGLTLDNVIDRFPTHALAYEDAEKFVNENRKRIKEEEECLHGKVTE